MKSIFSLFCETLSSRFVWLTCLLVGTAWIGGCGGQKDGSSDSSSRTFSEQTFVSGLPRETRQRVERFCGDCHPLPQPNTFPKDIWAEEVAQGFEFYIASKRSDLIEPTREEATRYFVEQAPEKVVVPRADQFPRPAAPVRFERLELAGPVAPAPISYSHLFVEQAAQQDRQGGSLLAADMRGGEVRRWQWEFRDDELSWRGESLGVGRNTCRITECDWNQDGLTDLLLGEIGSYGVGDHANGRVSILINDGQGTYQPTVLADNMARVVEAQLIDFDRDGDLDVLVAEFGYLKTGALWLLRNQGGDPLKPQLVKELLDPRHGPLGVRVVDIDRDGLLDYVVAYGQELESVEIHFGQKDGSYRGQLIMALPDPSYNSSSFEIVDLDNDGRLDILHTNGDTLDTFMAKPYHGVRWLRQMPEGVWETRELGLLVGALQTSTCDLDLDGDLDIVGISMFPGAGKDGAGAYDSIVWWEQQQGGQFVRHSVEMDNCDYAAGCVTDFDGDGRQDIIVSGWSTKAGQVPLRIYRNIGGSVGG